MTSRALSQALTVFQPHAVRTKVTIGGDFSRGQRLPAHHHGRIAASEPATLDPAYAHLLDERGMPNPYQRQATKP